MSATCVIYSLLGHLSPFLAPPKSPPSLDIQTEDHSQSLPPSLSIKDEGRGLGVTFIGGALASGGVVVATLAAGGLLAGGVVVGGALIVAGAMAVVGAGAMMGDHSQSPPPSLSIKDEDYQATPLDVQDEVDEVEGIEEPSTVGNRQILQLLRNIRLPPPSLGIQRPKLLRPEVLWHPRMRSPWDTLREWPWIFLDIQWPLYNTSVPITISMEGCNEEVRPLSYRDTIPYPGVLFLGDCYHATLTSQTKELKFEGIGLSISIPPGTISEGDVLNIEVLPCLTGPFVLPDDYEPASPAYLIRPQFEFTKPVELTVQHYFDLQTEEDCESMAFLTASSTPTYNSCVNPEYTFSEIEGNRGTFQIGERVGRIALKHFCKVINGKKCKRSYHDKSGIKRSTNAGEKLYSVRLYKEKFPTTNATIAIFTISLCHEVYIQHLKQILQERFPDVKFQCSQKEPVKLAADKVMLSIPDTPGWRIISDKIPEITREEIDFPFQDKQYAMSSDYPPTIHLDILPDEFSRSLTVCKLHVTGLSDSCGFNLILPPLHSCQVAAADVPVHKKPQPQSQTRKPELKELTKFAKTTKWYALGLQLDVDHYELEAILVDARGNTDEGRRRMLKLWLDSNEEPTWMAIVEALNAIKEQTLAAKIKAEFVH